MHSVINVSNGVCSQKESDNRWVKSYPDMPTSCWSTSFFGYQSMVVVAGGVTCMDLFTITRAVKVLHMNDHAHWSVVEGLSHTVYEAVPLIVNDNLYITTRERQ